MRPEDYRGSKPFQFSYPEGWTLRDDEAAVSLWKTGRGGAVTISSLANPDPAYVANALEYAAKFAEKNGLDGAWITGDASAAEASFDLADGGWCRSKLLARGPLVVLATYNTRSQNPAEEDEVAAIFASLQIAPATSG